jgi:hypothetical protein
VEEQEELVPLAEHEYEGEPVDKSLIFSQSLSGVTCLDLHPTRCVEKRKKKERKLKKKEKLEKKDFKRSEENC